MSFCICFDPGHGGIDSGAEGNGIKESETVLPITLEAGEIVSRHGLKVIFTRNTDINVALGERANIANNARADYFISVHANSAVPTGKGTETFAYKPGGQGEKLAQALQQSMVSNGISTANRGVKFANFQVLRETIMPAALLEILFISSAEDAAILKNRKHDIAVAIAKGVLNFLGIKFDPSTITPEPPKPAVMYRVILDGIQVEALSYLDKAEAEVRQAVDSGKAKAGKVQRNTDGVDLYFYPEVQPPKPTGKMAVMGSSDLFKEQMVKYLLNNNKVPAISITIEELVQLFLSEGAQEGVRGDIAFCQSILETGYFRYGGSVLPEQNNYGGIGAVNNSVRGQGAWFNSPQQGVRAQIQHLKAYGSGEALKNPCVDPRFNLVTRASALNWEDLDGKWAVPGDGYGERIISIYNAIKGIKIEPSGNSTGGDANGGTTTDNGESLLQLIINFIKRIFRSIFGKKE